jgi:hypothetical protein
MLMSSSYGIIVNRLLYSVCFWVAVALVLGLSNTLYLLIDHPYRVLMKYLNPGVVNNSDYLYLISVTRHIYRRAICIDNQCQGNNHGVPHCMSVSGLLTAGQIILIRKVMGVKFTLPSISTSPTIPCKPSS